jgi:hypothetical protein
MPGSWTPVRHTWTLPAQRGDNPVVTLLERESQLGSLLQYADEARARAGRLVLVSGEAGVGKSSLVEELHSQLPDSTWAWGACDSLFTPRPLAPLHDIAREVGGAVLDAVRNGLPREQLFDEVLHWLGDAEGLVVLVVEDVQWADEATLDLLRFLGRRVRDLPVLLVITFRDDAMAPNDPLRMALGELAGQRYTRRIDLPPLTADAVRRLAEGTSYSPVALYELTGGNPFFVVEVLSEQGSQVPASARDAVLSRAARLSEPARAALDLASLDTWRVDPQLVADAGGLSLDTFDELLAVGLLTADGDSLRFRHELARRATATTRRGWPITPRPPEFQTWSVATPRSQPAEPLSSAPTAKRSCSTSARFGSSPPTTVSSPSCTTGTPTCSPWSTGGRRRPMRVSTR